MVKADDIPADLLLVDGGESYICTVTAELDC
jgi:hypothetical protein